MSQEEIQIPKGWKVVKIKDVSELINGRAFKPEDWTKKGLPIIRIQNLNDHTKPFNYYDSEVDHKYLVNNGDLLFAWSGTPGTSFGAHIWKGEKAILNQHIYHVISKDEIIDKNYLKYALNRNLQEYIGKAHGGVGLRHITKGKLEDAKILLSPLKIQQKIVQKLDHMLGQLEEKKKQIISRIEKFDVKKINKNYKNHLLKLAFDGTLTGEEFEIIDGVKIPKGWKIKPLEKLGKIVTGSTPSTTNSAFFGNDYPFYKPADLDVGYLISTSKDGLSKLGLAQTRFLPKNSVLVVCIGASIGKASIISKVGASNQQINSIISNAQTDPKFLYYYIISHNFQNQIISHARTTAIPIIKKSTFSKLQIRIPSLETQKKIVQILDKKFADWENHKQELENIQKTHESIKKHLSDLSSSILNDAFSGKFLN